jgi:hypothetical protein
VVEKELAEVSPVSVEPCCIDNLKDVIRKLYYIEIVQVFGKLLARVVNKVLRIGCVSKEVSVKEVALFEDPQAKQSEAQVQEEPVNSLSHHLSLG